MQQPAQSRCLHRPGPPAAFSIQAETLQNLGLRVTKCRIQRPPRELHRAQRVLEPAVRGAGIHEEACRKLMNRAQPLHRPGVDDTPLKLGVPNELVNGISNLQSSPSVGRSHSGSEHVFAVKYASKLWAIEAIEWLGGQAVPESLGHRLLGFLTRL